MKRGMVLIAAAVLGVFLLSVPGLQGPGEASEAVKSIVLPSIQPPLKEGDGRVPTESYCNICHSVDYIPMQPRMTKAQWTASVNKMIKAFGAPIDEATAKTIADYLSVNYGTGK